MGKNYGNDNGVCRSLEALSCSTYKGLKLYICKYLQCMYIQNMKKLKNR